MNIRHSKPAFTTLFAAIALGAASLAGAAESGLSHNEQAAQHAIVDTSRTSITTTSHDANVATLAQNESAAQRAILVDFAAVSSPITVGSQAVALVVNERAAQRAIADAPRTRLAMPKAAAPVAAR